MHDIMRIAVREERHSHSVTRTATFDARAGRRQVFFEVSGDILLPRLEVHDFAVIAALFTAMREGRPIDIDGPVTATLLRNLEEFQEAWSLWRSRFRRVPITADQIVPAGSRSIAAACSRSPAAVSTAAGN